MPILQAVFVVGHANWGKSQTLRALTKGLQRSATINDVLFHIRRMSNDDIPKQLLAFIKNLDPKVQAAVLLALCPNFDEPWAKTEEILSIIKGKDYRMHFFVLERQFQSDQRISPEEISRLKAYGRVEVYGGIGDASERAAKLHRFMESAVVA